MYEDECFFDVLSLETKDSLSDPRVALVMGYAPRAIDFKLYFLAGECRDKASNCRGLESYCGKSNWQDFMERNCKKTCGKCKCELPQQCI